MCRTGNFNLSYDSLTGYEARQKLHDLKTTDPDFLAELTQKATVKLIVHPNEVIAEDEDTVNPLFKDNSDLPCEAIIANITSSSPANVASTSNGDMMSTAAAESLDDNEMEIPKALVSCLWQKILRFSTIKNYSKEGSLSTGGYDSVAMVMTDVF